MPIVAIFVLGMQSHCAVHTDSQDTPFLRLVSCLSRVLYRPTPKHSVMLSTSAFDADTGQLEILCTQNLP